MSWTAGWVRAASSVPTETFPSPSAQAGGAVGAATASRAIAAVAANPLLKVLKYPFTRAIVGYPSCPSLVADLARPQVRRTLAKTGRNADEPGGPGA
ncbi:hypothetical protein Misp02_49160 [Microtetraspora sp. NBRC 16547]|nr:hypothetical protein Misp02_49160 [Microtetraspora sp. NBRC 16547]